MYLAGGFNINIWPALKISIENRPDRKTTPAVEGTVSSNYRRSLFLNLGLPLRDRREKEHAAQD